MKQKSLSIHDVVPSLFRYYFFFYCHALFLRRNPRTPLRIGRFFLEGTRDKDSVAILTVLKKVLRIPSTFYDRIRHIKTSRSYYILFSRKTSPLFGFFLVCVDCVWIFAIHLFHVPQNVLLGYYAE